MKPANGAAIRTSSNATAVTQASTTSERRLSGLRRHLHSLTVVERITHLLRGTRAVMAARSPRVASTDPRRRAHTHGLSHWDPDARGETDRPAAGRKNGPPGLLRACRARDAA